MQPLTTYRSLLTLLALTLLAGCASIEKARDSWQGAHYDEVISRWGAPYRSTKLADGSPVHTWVAEGGYSGGPATSIGIFGGSGGGGGGIGVGTGFIFGGGGGEPSRCERTLIFRNDRVVDQNWLGDPSLCSTFAREVTK
jgi:hypothetical protein